MPLRCLSEETHDTAAAMSGEAASELAASRLCYERWGQGALQLENPLILKVHVHISLFSLLKKVVLAESTSLDPSLTERIKVLQHFTHTHDSLI